jgi:lysophospholipase L1-like esterase
MDELRFHRDAWYERTPGLRRRILRIVLVDALVFAALVAVGELAVRAWVPDCRRFLYGEAITAGNPIVLNSAKLREREFPRQRPPGETRILCIGDSVTFGSGLSAGRAWPRQLERALQADFEDGRLFVINAADQGQSLREAIELLNQRWLEYEPSLVVFGFSSSMIGQPDVLAPVVRNAGSPSPVQTGLAVVRRVGLHIFEGVHSSSCLYTLAAAAYRRVQFRLQIRQQPLHQGGLLAYAFDAPGLDLERIERLYAGHGLLLGELKRLLDERGIPLVVVNLPARFELSGAAADNEFLLDRDLISIRPGARIAETCRELRIPYVDLLPGLRALRAAMLAGAVPWDDLYVQIDYAHLNERGCRVAAQELRRTLLEHAGLADWRNGRTPFQTAVARRADREPLRSAERPRPRGL